MKYLKKHITNESHDTYDIFPEYLDQKEMLYLMFDKAVETNNVESVEHLIKTYNVNPGVTVDGRTSSIAIQQACINGNLPMLKILMADKRIYLPDSTLLLKFTINGNFKDLTKLLLEDMRIDADRNIMRSITNRFDQNTYKNLPIDIIKLISEKPSFKKEMLKSTEYIFEEMEQIYGYAEDFQQSDIFDNQHILEDGLLKIVNSMDELKNMI